MMQFENGSILRLMPRSNPYRWSRLLAFLIGYAIIMLTTVPAPAHDDGQWGNNDPAITKWYRDLMRPDVPQLSCCGEADAYWCDTVHVKDGKTFCTITDDRPDEPRMRPHVDVGTVIEVPDNKLKWDSGNPTGHNIIFLSRGQNSWLGNDASPRYVLCFVQGTGI
jgi:hypothetical protein